MICPQPKTIRVIKGWKDKESIIVPCGKCATCIKKRVTDWKIRFQEEAKNHIANCFITLTYADEHLPKKGVDLEHVKKFNNHLKQYFQFKYYIISEYGPKTHRPHYHGLYFGVDTYTPGFCDRTRKIWDKGFVTFGVLYPQRINYVAEYHISKTMHPKGANKNFNCISQGLGKSYIQKQKSFHSSTKNLYYPNKGFKLALPRYYKDKLYTANERQQVQKEIQQKFDKEEIEAYMKDPLFYLKRQQTIEYMHQQYINRKIKKGKL